MDKVQKTQRGFSFIEFLDSNGQRCDLQQSSAIDDSERGLDNPGSSFIWLGLEKERMHLDRGMVHQLIDRLSTWHETGQFDAPATENDYLKLFTNNTAKGHWPVGFTAIVLAKNALQASSMLESELAQRGLKQKVSKDDMVRVSTSNPSVTVLVDGEY